MLVTDERIRNTEENQGSFLGASQEEHGIHCGHSKEPTKIKSLAEFLQDMQ